MQEFMEKTFYGNNILFIYYIKSGADILGTQAGVNMTTLTRFTEAGLDFAYPTQTIYTKTS